MAGHITQLGVGTGAPLPPAPPPAPDPPVWPPAAQWCMAIVVAAGLALVGYRGWGLSRYSAQPLPLERAAIDINEADEIDLQLLPGVGPGLAKRIVEKKPYRAVEELRRVPGVGPETMERLRPHVQVGEAPPRVVRAKPHDDAPPPQGKKKPPDAPIDLNRATPEELARLPGIGPTLAKRIVEGRPFASVAELRRVKGIGAKTLEKLRPHVVVDEE
jgi:competence protein ComEA